MIYEMRVYICAPGRIAALHNRFRTTTTRKFREHGVKVIGYWTDKYGESNRLTYIVQWKDEAERTAKWGAFGSDPEWLAARAASEAPENGGPIVANVINTLMTPTDYSELQ
ncbi:MAG: NIPSNAP family protein [Chloroflexota bacterium]|nr:MAG: NIPSNAP family protein [Chloroflexota bacterium]